MYYLKMEIRFHPHAVERMQQRLVTVDDVKSIISSPDGRIPQSRDKAILYKRIRSRKDNLVAAVIVEKMPDNVIEVITVMINFEVKK